ncbi:cytochrome c family protein [Sphingomonas koreensis]|nr:cytochrome c family protein [Sphingomonas koreensis]
MDNRTNTIAGWTLAGLASALALSIVGGMVLHSERPEKMGYPIEGVEEAGGDAAAAAITPIANRLATADPAKGAETFKKCAACHTINQGGPNGQGPNLYATVGEAIAQGKNGFAFSDALKSIGGTWTFDALDKWLTSPRKFANGTKMTFAGLSDPQDRANVIAYLNAQGSNLPLPKPEAAPAAAAGAAPDNAAAPASENAAEANVTSSTDVTNQATPAPGAPSVDPNAAKQAAKQD